ncbi:MAG: hypothetical protein EOP49_05260, partial [Sphingobacteriales bacterium]
MGGSLHLRMFMGIKEIQRFRQWWLWLILGAIPAILAIEFYVSGQGRQEQLSGLIAAAAVPALLMLLFAFMKLEIKADQAGIQYRFSPLLPKWVFISWNAIEEVQVRRYKPIGEYGGWGLRSTRKYGRALNTSGNMGIQLMLKDGSKLLLGTQKPELWRQFLENKGGSNSDIQT